VYIQEQWPNIDWYKYLRLWERLPPDMRHVADTLGVLESFLAQAVQGRIPERTDSQRDIHRIHRRFFTTLALHDLVREAPIRHVAQQYGATKGLLQTLQNAAGMFAGMVTVFCSKLGWTNLELLLSQFQSRLLFGIERELCDLVRISLLNGFRARVLYNAGYHTLTTLATANPLLIETTLRNAVPFRSYKLAREGGNHSAVHNTWCEKLRKGLTESEAAITIVNEARVILSGDLHIPLSAWSVHAQHLPFLNSKPGAMDSESTDVGNRRKSPTVGLFQEELTRKKPRRTTLFKLPSTPAEFSTTTVVPADNIGQHHQIPPQPTLNLSPIGLASYCGGTLDNLPVAKELSFSDASLSSSSHLESVEKSQPCTIPDSFTYSDNTSMSFSFQTLAMIDAVCDAAKLSGSMGSTAAAAAAAEVSGTVGSGSGCPIMREHENEAKKQLSLSSCISLALNEYLPDDSNEKLTTPLEPIKCFPESPFQLHPSSLKELSSLCSSQLSQSGLTLINVTSNRVLFNTFVSECMEQKMVAFSVACTNTDQSDGIGSVIVKPKCGSGIPILPLQKEQVIGVTFNWGGADVYFISLCEPCPESEFHCSLDTISLADRVDAIRTLFEHKNHWEKLVAYDMKRHAKNLALSCGTMPAASLVTMDPIVADWMLNPDAKEKTVHKMVLQYLSDQPLLSWCDDSGEMPLSSLATKGGGDLEMQASAECVLAYMLITKLEILLEAEGLRSPYLKLEMPSLLVLTKVELNGIGFSPDECTNQKDFLQVRVLELEEEAYHLAGHTFSLTSSDDVASVLFLELKLPHNVGNSTKQLTLGTTTRRVTKKRLQHLSTAKEVLEKIRTLHPLPGIILEWRRISSTLSKTVYPLFKEAVAHKELDCFRIHPRIQIFTATGRVAIVDPSLQMVPKEFDIGSNSTLLSDSQYLRVCGKEKLGDATPPSTVNMRSVFQPFPGGLFLAADYSQLELRILAHMSGDRKLKQFFNSEGDAFNMIAGEWLGLPATAVSSKERQDTKQICYGMIYGIGAKALGEQMGVTDKEASQFMETFKSKYPTVKKFISSTIQGCKDRGYVTTLLGRKRFLPAIHSANIHTRRHAERQALNSTIQGSAADLVKTAMVNIDKKIAEHYDFSVTCILPSVSKGIGHAAYLVLQLHDELVYEVQEGNWKEVADIVQYEMENALDLSIKFPVKMKTGSSWGNLRSI
jgi:DNA polymerase theta